MTDQEIYAKLEDINVHLSAHTTIMNEVLKPQLDEIVEQNKIRNGRIQKLVYKVVARDMICVAVQDGKIKRVNSFWKWFSASLVIAGIIAGILVKTKRNVAPIEFYYQKNDSTVYIPKMYIRGDHGELREVSLDYFPEIKKR